MTLRIAVALSAAAWLAGCNATTPRPNVAILLVDALRPDHLGCYGYGRTTSPAVDALAERGTVFTGCYATADYTSASTASLFTGRYPLAHGYVNADCVLEADNVTVAELLRQQGYRTAAFIANGLVGKKYGMDQGFDLFYERNRAPASDLFAQMDAFVRARTRAPFFLYAHFMEVHDPCRLPAADWGRFADPGRFAHDMADTLLHERFVMGAWWQTTQRWADPDLPPDRVARYFADYAALYDAAIASWDQQLRDFLQVLESEGLAHNTIVLVVADHGEQLLEHGFFGHANSGYEVGLRVPLIWVDPPAQRQGPPLPRTIDQRVSLVDVLPTLLTRLGMVLPTQIQGTERWNLARNAAAVPADTEQTVYTEGTFMANRPFSTLIQTCTQGRWKLILDRFRDTKELYDLQADPAEQHDVFTGQPQVVARLAEELRQRYTQDLDVLDHRQRPQVEQGAQKAAELRALGYLAGGRLPLRSRTEFFPMRPLPQAPYGPFGDEEDLPAFSRQIDFTGGPVAWGQVIRGFSGAVDGADPQGAWFDRRATFLFAAAGGARSVVFDITVAPDRWGGWPTQVEVEFDGAVVHAWPIAAPGEHRLRVPVPAALQGAVPFQCGLRANHRFVLRAGASPRYNVYGALRVRRVALEG
jgi:arylsulfatase A-like enzyme